MNGKTARMLVSGAALAAGLLAAPLEASANDYDYPRFFVVNGRFAFQGNFGCGRFNCAGWDHQFTAGVDLGFRIFKDKWRARKSNDPDALYIGLTPTFGFFGWDYLWIPAAFEYDIPLPVKGLYVYPRSEIGPGFVFDTCNGCSMPWHFMMAHMGGVKYHVGKHFQVGGDLGWVGQWIFVDNFTDQGNFFRVTGFVGGQFGG